MIKIVSMALVIFGLSANQLRADNVLILEGGYYIDNVKIIANQSGDIIFKRGEKYHKINNQHIIRIEEVLSTKEMKPLSMDEVEKYIKKNKGQYALDLSRLKITGISDSDVQLGNETIETQRRLNELTASIDNYKQLQIMQNLFGAVGLSVGVFFTLFSTVLTIQQASSSGEATIVRWGIGIGGMLIGQQLLISGNHSSEKIQELNYERQQIKLSIKPQISSKMTGLVLEVNY